MIPGKIHGSGGLLEHQMLYGHDSRGIQEDGWTYNGHPEPSKDCRKLVMLQDGGMEWIGIRAWNHEGRYWMNNSEPERCKVLCWRDLPDFPRGFWVDGQLHFRPMSATDRTGQR